MFSEIGRASPPPFVADTIPAEAAPVFAVFEGRDLRCQPLWGAGAALIFIVCTTTTEATPRFAMFEAWAPRTRQDRVLTLRPAAHLLCRTAGEVERCSVHGIQQILRTPVIIRVEGPQKSAAQSTFPIRVPDPQVCRGGVVVSDESGLAIRPQQIRHAGDRIVIADPAQLVDSLLDEGAVVFRIDRRATVGAAAPELAHVQVIVAVEGRAHID